MEVHDVGKEARKDLVLHDAIIFDEELVVAARLRIGNELVALRHAETVEQV